MNEFNFIEQYLIKNQGDSSVLLGIGDDAAIVRPRPDWDLCISSDMLLAGRHFFVDTKPEDLAHKVLSVNLSDMAAMGAVPKWVLLSVALPVLDKDWLKSFCNRFYALCDEYGVSLIGGDTTKGDWVFNVTIFGEVPKGRGLLRCAAREGDDVWVSGRLGSAAAALQHLFGNFVLPQAVFRQCEQALLRPTPRVGLGQSLLVEAHAAQDISDGLIQDLGHILDASGAGAEIFWQDIPVLPELRDCLSSKQLHQCVLAGGDDYELLFTADAGRRGQIEALAWQCGVPVSRIGRVVAGKGIRILDEEGGQIALEKYGFDHFA